METSDFDILTGSSNSPNYPMRDYPTSADYQHQYSFGGGGSGGNPFGGGGSGGNPFGGGGSGGGVVRSADRALE